MDREEARNLALSLMRKHGFGDWTFRFSRAARMAGTCHLLKKEITLSGRYVDINDRAEVLDTILHEIAHACVGLPGARERDRGHGPMWKKQAALLGARPKACIEQDEAVHVPPKWRAWCPGCNDFVPGGKHRMSEAIRNRRWTCRKCHSRITWVDCGTTQLAQLKKSC